MKAYYHGDEDGIEFVFAETPEDAERIADSEVTAAPEFDKYAPGPVQDSQIYAEGWGVCCRNCEHRITSDGCDECEDAGHAGEVVVSGHAVFCNANCQRKAEERWDRVKRKKHVAQECLLVAVPFATIVSSFVGAPGECKENCFRNDHENVVVQFTFPGSKMFEKYRTTNSYCYGCGCVFVSHGDVEKYRELMGKDAAHA